MSNVIQPVPVSANEYHFPDPVKVKKAILIAVSVLMALGMIVCYAVGAPWLLTVTFFLLTLSPLFPLGKSIDDQRSRLII